MKCPCVSRLVCWCLSCYNKVRFYQLSLFVLLPKGQDDEMSSWQNVKFTKWQVDKMTSWQNCKLTKWQVDKTVSWRNVKLTKWQVDKMTSWQNCKLTKWQVDEMTSWRNGKLTKWQVDKMANWWNDQAPTCKWIVNLWRPYDCLPNVNMPFDNWPKKSREHILVEQ